MKGFIEFHDESGKGIVVGIGNISFIDYEGDEKEKGCRIGFIVGLKGVWVYAKETYEEIKALIAEAQGDVDPNDYVSKKNLQKWLADKLAKTKKNSYEGNVYQGFLEDLCRFIGKEESND